MDVHFGSWAFTLSNISLDEMRTGEGDVHSSNNTYDDCTFHFKNSGKKVSCLSLYEMGRQADCMSLIYA